MSNARSFSQLQKNSKIRNASGDVHSILSVRSPLNGGYNVLIAAKRYAIVRMNLVCIQRFCIR